MFMNAWVNVQVSDEEYGRLVWKKKLHPFCHFNFINIMKFYEI